METKREPFYELRYSTNFLTSNSALFHWHDSYEICYIIENKCTFLIDGKKYFANIGDIVTINEKTVHKYIADSGKTAIRLIQFSPKILLNEYKTAAFLKSHITAEEIKNIPGLKESLNDIFSIMEREKNYNTIKENPFLKSIFVSLYLLLLKHFSQKISSKTKNNNNRNDFYKIISFINENYTNHINGKTISSKLFISQKRINSLFKKYSGASFLEYLNSLKIQNANYLLKEGYTVTQAAFESGFSCIRTFNNVYKKYMKITPKEYIQKNASE